MLTVMNATDELRALYRGTRIVEAHVIIKCDRVEGLFPATPRYDDDSEDFKEGSWLQNRCVKYHRATTFHRRATF